MTIEATLRVVKDAKNHRERLKDLVWAVFYAVCAVNLFPYSPVVGAATFVVHSLYTEQFHAYLQDPYFVTKTVGEILFVPTDRVVR